MEDTNSSKKINYSTNVTLESNKELKDLFKNEEQTIKIRIIKEIIIKSIEKGYISVDKFDLIEKKLVKIFLNKA